jgi:hypothetical protein
VVAHSHLGESTGILPVHVVGEYSEYYILQCCIVYRVGNLMIAKCDHLRLAVRSAYCTVKTKTIVCGLIRTVLGLSACIHIVHFSQTPLSFQLHRRRPLRSSLTTRYYGLVRQENNKRGSSR